MTVVLADDANVTLRSVGVNRSGIEVGSYGQGHLGTPDVTPAILTIQCAHSHEDDHICDASCGKLNAIGGRFAAGIGGGSSLYSKGTINIEGGYVSASGSNEGKPYSLAGDIGARQNQEATNYTVNITGGAIATTNRHKINAANTNITGGCFQNADRNSDRKVCGADLPSGY